MTYQIVDEKIIGKAVGSDGSFTQMKLMHIICDTAAEIPEPEPAWSAGSRCDILENGGNVYLLSTAREWKPVNFYNRGGGGDGFDPDNYYTKSQTDSIISGKVDKITGKGLSTEDYTTDEKTKLAGIEAEANKTVVDSALNSTSTNPVQNKAVYSEIMAIMNAVPTLQSIKEYVNQQNYISKRETLNSQGVYNIDTSQSQNVFWTPYDGIYYFRVQVNGDPYPSTTDFLAPDVKIYDTVNGPQEGDYTINFLGSDEDLEDGKYYRFSMFLKKGKGVYFPFAITDNGGELIISIEAEMYKQRDYTIRG